MATDTITASLLNHTECLQVVTNSFKLPTDDQIKLISYRITRGSSELLGFMGEYYKLNVCVQDKTKIGGTQELCFFVKSVPISNEFHKDECERKGFFYKETSIYKHILPNVQKYASSKLYPECYFTRHDLIVLEDLSAAPEGFRHIASKESYTPQHHQVMLRHLAKLHAGSIAWELNENVNIGEKFKNVLFEMQLTTKNEWYTTGAESIIYLAKIHPKFQTPLAQTFITKKLYKVLCEAEQLTEPSKEFRNVLCHRDSWDRNIFYKFDNVGVPNDCRIVDFQLTRYSPPGIDVLFFLYVTTTKEQRARIYNDMLDYYHNELRVALREHKLAENLITKEEFLKDCKRARLAVIILMAICVPLMKMPEGLANKMRAEEPERFDFYMNYKRDELFERVMALDAGYKEIILAPVEEIMDYLLQIEGIIY